MQNFSYRSLLWRLLKKTRRRGLVVKSTRTEQVAGYVATVAIDLKRRRRYNSALIN
jgi:acetolactate synthase regulatory subunit